MTTPRPRRRPNADERLTHEDSRIDRCRRCGAWRYDKVCTGACPTLRVLR